MGAVRTRSKIIVGIVIVCVLALVWWLASPLFLNESVDEALPSGSATVEQKEKESTPEASPPSTEETEAALSGQFVDGEKNYKTSGNIKTLTVDDTLYLRFEDFQTTNGPDLFVYLVEPGENTADGIRLGALKGNQGNQNYKIPKDVDLTKHSRVVIWCRAFDADFGTGDLKAMNE
ncbi:DM13 domain-containing protein [Exiguobacterium acetylicum]|nr:DM13 domain-containing protein [Exiguobacterium acetylicum]